VKQFSFLDWPIYKDSRDFYHFCINLIKRLPREYEFTLGNQLIRSSSSISLNIAEGSAKATKKDFSHFLSIALGSLYETLANLDLLRSSGFISQEEFDLSKNKASNIANQLGGLKRKLTP